VTRSVYAEYLNGSAAAFYGAHFADSAARREAVRRARRPLSPRVADVIEEQCSRLAASATRDAHLRALRRGAAAVVTGQQVGLFLGPLFTIYKAASAVAAARALSAELGESVAPVFWLQTEDHDLPEIAECHVPRAAGDVLTLRIASSRDHRVSLAHCELPPEVDDCLSALASEIGSLPCGGAHLERLRRHYKPRARWADAFAGLLAELFADDGLVLIDPRDPRLAEAAAPLHRRAITDAAAIADNLTERCRELEAAGFASTVHVRAGAPLSFVHPLGAVGPRYRLVPTAEGYAEVGGERSHDVAGLCARLEASPTDFSTSVLLRPILQDTLLPTAVFIGGPAEVAYFAQLPPLYAAYGMTMPIVLPRAGFRLIEDATAKLLARLRLEPSAASLSEDELLAAARGSMVGGEVGDLSQRLVAPFEQTLRELQPAIEAAGQGLDAAVEKTRVTVAGAVAKLAGKIENARLHRDEGLLREVRHLRQRLYPNGLPQERVFSLPYFAARYGDTAVVRRVVDAIDPFAPKMKDLSLR